MNELLWLIQMPVGFIPAYGILSKYPTCSKPFSKTYLCSTCGQRQMMKGAIWKEKKWKKPFFFFFFFLRWFRDSDQNKVILIHFYQRWQVTCLLFIHFFFFFGFPFLFVRFFKYILLSFPGKMFLCFRD